MADDTSTSATTSGRTRKGKLGEMVDCKIGGEIVNPRGDVLTMGANKYVLDQVGQHDVNGTVYDVTDDDSA